MFRQMLNDAPEVPRLDQGWKTLPQTVRVEFNKFLLLDQFFRSKYEKDFACCQTRILSFKMVISDNCGFSILVME